MLLNKTSNYSYTSIFITICLELITITTEFLKKSFLLHLYTLVKKKENKIPFVHLKYQWNYSSVCLKKLARTGIEPVTLGLWVPCSTTKLPSLHFYFSLMWFLFNLFTHKIVLYRAQVRKYDSCIFNPFCYIHNWTYFWIHALDRRKIHALAYWWQNG